MTDYLMAHDSLAGERATKDEYARLSDAANQAEMKQRNEEAACASTRKVRDEIRKLGHYMDDLQMCSILSSLINVFGQSRFLGMNADSAQEAILDAIHHLEK